MSPYLSRLGPEDMVEGRRRALYSQIFDAPGISYTELRDATNIRCGVLQYHLETLERAGFVESVKAGRYRRYFPLGLDDSGALKARAYAADPKNLRALVDVETLSGSTSGQLHRMHPAVSRQAVAYRLERLEAVGALVSEPLGKARAYSLSVEGSRILALGRSRPGVEGHCTEEPPVARADLESRADAAGAVSQEQSALHDAAQNEALEESPLRQAGPRGRHASPVEA